MTNSITLAENTLLKILRATDDNGKEFIVKCFLCAVQFGDEFFNEVKEYVEQKDKNAVLSIVEKYTSKL